MTERNNTQPPPDCQASNHTPPLNPFVENMSQDTLHNIGNGLALLELVFLHPSDISNQHAARSGMYILLGELHQALEYEVKRLEGFREL